MSNDLTRSIKAVLIPLLTMPRSRRTLLGGIAVAGLISSGVDGAIGEHFRC